MAKEHEKKYIKCPVCGGSGVNEDRIRGCYLACETCHGEGILEEVNEAMNVKVDPTNPDHYKNHTSLECIEAMEIIFGKAAVLDFCACNAWKYIWRWKNKNGVEDLKKARWYVDRAQTLINDNFVVAARKEILIRMGDYVDKYIKESEE